MKFSLLYRKKDWTAFILVVILLRLIYAGIGAWVVSSGGPIPLNEKIYGVMYPYLVYDYFSRVFINPWFGWDTVSYLEIAILGYQPDASVAFMPLYPLLIRLGAFLIGGNHLLAALILSTLFCITSLILLYELLSKMVPKDTARGVVIFFISFPTAFFLLAGYTESLFITLVLAFWLLAQRRQWFWAGICAGLATLTRLQGVVLSAVLVWMIWMDLLENPAPSFWSQLRQLWNLVKSSGIKTFCSIPITAWAAVLMPVIAALWYQVWLKVSGFGTTKEALLKYWRLETVAPWTGFALFLQRLPTRHFNYMDWIDLTLFIIVLITALIGLRRLDPAFSIYVWLTLAIYMMRGTPPHLLASYSRYFLALFPLFLLPAMNAKRYLRLTILSVSFSLQIILATIFLWGSWVA